MQLLNQVIHLKTKNTVFETTTCQQEVYEIFRTLRVVVSLI